MPQRFVETPDGKLALFSTIVDAFVWYDMTDEEAIELCDEEWGMRGEDAVKKVGAARKDPGRWLREIAMPGWVSSQSTISSRIPLVLALT